MKAAAEKDLSIHGVVRSSHFLERTDRILPVLDPKPLIAHIYHREDAVRGTAPKSQYPSAIGREVLCGQ